ncbi:MAG TPA: hypothetical protein VGD27_11920 [Longimicrobiales bacterium]
MGNPYSAPRREYQAWVEEQIEEYKTALTRDELLDLAEQAVNDLFTTPDGQYPLTEILLRDAVDTLLFKRMNLPDYKQWLKLCRSDTSLRPSLGTTSTMRAAG